MRIRFIGLMIIAMLVFAAPASAQTSDAYGGEAGIEQVSGSTGNGGGGGGSPEVTPSSNNSGSNGATQTVSSNNDRGGSLPFTGFQAGLVALFGLALVGTGLAVRRVSRTGLQV